MQHPKPYVATSMLASTTLAIPLGTRTGTGKLYTSELGGGWWFLKKVRA